jgi:hypothetical protein
VTEAIRKRRVYSLTALALTLSAPASAQAWIPEKGEGTLTLTFEDTFVRSHLLSDGSRVDTGHIRSYILVQDVDYGVTDKLAVDVSLPFVLSKYYGPRPHQLPIDNGSYHGAFQDFRINVRYNLRSRPFMLTPFIALGVPSNSYEYFAHSAAGTQMKEFTLGTNLGRSLAPVLPHAYFQALYAFGIPQEVIGVRTIHSHIGWELGYFLSGRLAVRTLGDMQIGHSGKETPQDFPIASRTLTNTNWRHHDQTSKISYLILGGGPSFAVSKSWSAFAALTTNVWGRNGHALALGEIVGLTWSFRAPWSRPRTALDESSDMARGEEIRRNERPHHVH